MAVSTKAKTVSSLFLGTCLPSLKHNASKFEVNYLYFDEYLKAYFPKFFVLFAFDEQKICKTGDIALIQEIPERINFPIRHKVLEVVYPCGDVTDPCTGEKVVSTISRNDLEKRNLLYGKVKTSFNYKTQPSRGWQEGKKDFSHRPTYQKYNEFEEGDENKDQPFAV